MIPDWFISDTHLGHANINTHCQRITPECRDQGSVEWLMIRNWRALVKPEDTVLHLGDLAWRGYDLKVLSDLPGRKLFVRGNHDGHLSPEDLAAIGFTEIDPPTYLIDGGELLCTHYPQRLADKGSTVNVHGHVHNNAHASTDRHLNVSVECWHYAPVRGSFIVSTAESLLRRRASRTDDAYRVPRVVHYKGRR